MYPTNEQEYQADLDAQGEAETELARQTGEYQQMLRERANLDNMNKAQEKAKELIEFFSSVIPIEASINDTSEEAIRKMRNDWIATKQCALKVCDEFISNGTPKQVRFYKHVRKEIENYEQ